jgi:hypothetical protein
VRQRLLNCAQTIGDAGVAYLAAAGTRSFYALPASLQPLDASDEELGAVYGRCMTPKKAPGRRIYDIIRNSQQTCPHCGQGIVKTLDHYLPKTRYRHLSVLPDNLVPCCHDCNNAKLEAYPLSAPEQTFHPYFDDVQTEKWLFAEVIFGGGVSLGFSVKRPVTWTQLQFERARSHFGIFKLGTQFSIFAGQELVNIRALLRKTFDAGGADTVRVLLNDAADSARNAQLNSWKTATYETLAASDDFCDEGFDQLP